MPLKVYAGSDIHSGIEFIVRANNLDEAQQEADLLTSEIQVARQLVASNFSRPKRLASSLRDDHYSSITREDPFVPLEIYHLLVLDGQDLSRATTPISASTTLTNNFQIMAWIQFLNYDGAGRQVIASNWNENGDERVYTVAMDDGALVFQVSENGDDVTTVSFDLDPVHDTGFWVRALMADSGPTASIITVSTSDESQLLEPGDVTWFQRASAFPTFNTLSDTGNFLFVGTESTTTFTDTNVPNGNIGRVTYIQGTDSNFANNTIVADMNPNGNASIGDEEWDSSTGETWSLNGRATIGIPISGGGILAFLLGGEVGSYLSTGDAVPDFSGNFVLALWIEFVDYITDQDQALIHKGQGGASTQAYGFATDATENDEANISNGTTQSIVDGSTTEYVNGEGIWTAVQWEESVREISFYRSSDPLSKSFTTIDWTPKTSGHIIPQTQWDATNAEDIAIGAQSDGTDPLAAIIGRAIVVNGLISGGNIVGTLEKEMYPDRDYLGVEPMVSTTTGESWTFNGDISVVRV